MAIDRYFLGCPIWSRKDWVGHLYRRSARPAEYLAQYAAVFNAVEGNTTFYSVPREDVVERWRETTPASFRFCFKLPRTITHDLRLRNADFETDEFLRRMAPLGERLGPFMIQLPPSFGPESIDVLAAFLNRLPADFHFSVELRHRDYYGTPESSRRVDELLYEHRAERILMDTRPLRSGDPDHPEMGEALGKKPDLPIRPVAIGERPILRLINHPEQPNNEPWIERWCRTLTHWIEQGRRPYVFVHCPNDFHSPAISRRLHAVLSKNVDVGEMPAWPADTETRQLSLL